MASIDWDNNLLCSWDALGNKVYIWTYSEFERFLPSAICPSMYHSMASYVLNNITNENLKSIDDWDYAGGNLEAAAVDAYFELSAIERWDRHSQELVNLRAAKHTTESKETAAIDAMLEANKPFDHTSPIDQEYCDFMRGIIATNRAAVSRLENEIHEEMVCWPAYDPILDDSTQDMDVN
jgi:hypothetical protein